MYSVRIRVRRIFLLLFGFHLNIFLFIFIPFLIPPVVAAAGNTDDLFSRGVEAYNSFSDAGINLSVELFEAAIKEAPSSSPAHAALAEGYIQQYLRTGSNDKKLLKKATSLAERSLLLDAKSPMAHKTLGTTYFASGKPEEAIEEFERAVDMEPGYARAWLNLGSSYHRIGDIKTAASHFARAAELKNDPLAEALAHYNLAALSYEKGDYTKALSSYDKAKTILPKYHNIYYGMGITLMQLDRDKEAVDLFKKAIELKAGDADFHMGLASAYHRLGKKAEAKAAYYRALDIDPDMEDARQGLMGLEGMNIGPLNLY
ncbi:MAG: tetratricopeptide repeat protein [Proteobacteria bacterium]|nr:tetratricopeptide repeat protein [Pseudomonadota bacterium]